MLMQCLASVVEGEREGRLYQRYFQGQLLQIVHTESNVLFSRCRSAFFEVGTPSAGFVSSGDSNVFAWVCNMFKACKDRVECHRRVFMPPRSTGVQQRMFNPPAHALPSLYISCSPPRQDVSAQDTPASAGSGDVGESTQGRRSGRSLFGGVANWIWGRNRADINPGKTGEQPEAMDLQAGEAGGGDSSIPVDREGPPPTATTEGMAAMAEDSSPATSAVAPAADGDTASSAPRVRGQGGQGKPRAGEETKAGIPDGTAGERPEAVDLQAGEAAGGDSSSFIGKEDPPPTATTEGMAAMAKGSRPATSSVAPTTDGDTTSSVPRVRGQDGQGKPRTEEETNKAQATKAGVPDGTAGEQPEATDLQAGEAGDGDSSMPVDREGPPPTATTEGMAAIAEDSSPATSAVAPTSEVMDLEAGEAAGDHSSSFIGQEGLLPTATTEGMAAMAADSSPATSFVAPTTDGDATSSVPCVRGQDGQGKPRTEEETNKAQATKADTPVGTDGERAEATDLHQGEAGGGDSSMPVDGEGPPPTATTEGMATGSEGGLPAAISSTNELEESPDPAMGKKVVNTPPAAVAPSGPSGVGGGGGSGGSSGTVDTPITKVLLDLTMDDESAPAASVPQEPPSNIDGSDDEDEDGVVDVANVDVAGKGKGKAGGDTGAAVGGSSGGGEFSQPACPVVYICHRSFHTL